MVIHGAIDGFSRKILYLSCTNNNKATSVVSYFSQAVTKLGLPDKVRSDKGSENVDVWRYILHYHNMDHSCIVVGSVLRDYGLMSSDVWGNSFTQCCILWSMKLFLIPLMT